ncbi:hypothetical protein [Nonomuraea sp. NPDC003214]
MLTHLAAAALLTLTPTPSPSTAAQVDGRWDCANEFRQDDGDAGGSSGETTGYWSGSTSPSVTASFAANGEVLRLRNGLSPRWVDADLYRITPSGNTWLADASTAASGRTRDLSLAEGLKVFIRLTYNGNVCTSNVFTS